MTAYLDTLNSRSNVHGKRHCSDATADWRATKVPRSVAPPALGDTDRIVAMLSSCGHNGTTDGGHCASEKWRAGARPSGGAQARQAISNPLCNPGATAPGGVAVGFLHHPPVPVLTPIERSFCDRSAQTQSVAATVGCRSCEVHVKFAFRHMNDTRIGTAQRPLIQPRQGPTCAS
jgi:hypothetical protein